MLCWIDIKAGMSHLRVVSASFASKVQRERAFKLCQNKVVSVWWRGGQCANNAPGRCSCGSHRKFRTLAGTKSFSTCPGEDTCRVAYAEHFVPSTAAGDLWWKILVHKTWSRLGHSALDWKQASKKYGKKKFIHFCRKFITASVKRNTLMDTTLVIYQDQVKIWLTKLTKYSNNKAEMTPIILISAGILNLKFYDQQWLLR